MKYSDQLSEWLRDLGYTHYFYVGGGNIMHLTESLDRYLTGIPVVHEVAAGIAAEYFNEINSCGQRALALVTTGPGITNIVTAVAGAWLESRELLVIGGQVKTQDLSNGEVRGRGIQEIDGVSLMTSISKASIRIDKPLTSKIFGSIVKKSWSDRKGPVFLEIPLDVQAMDVNASPIIVSKRTDFPTLQETELKKIVDLYNKSTRPILLLGGGLDFDNNHSVSKLLTEKNVPVMTTYNGADRIDGHTLNYLGRPNTWGQRSSNIIIQNSDLIIAIGTRLGLQQTGFNWEAFGRSATIVQIDIDETELNKGHPIVDLKLPVDANDFVQRFLAFQLQPKTDWLIKANKIRNIIPRVEDVNHTGEGYISPYTFITELENITTENDLIVPCSSGSAFTLTMQLYKQKLGQRIITNKSLASMGYGLSGAIGACIAEDNKKRTVLIEGDGGFAQNMQEMGTLGINNLNIKVFIFHDQGHASIRMTQQNYFAGKYLGCDRSSGLGLPDWSKLFAAWNIPVMTISNDFSNNLEFVSAFETEGPQVFVVTIDPEQTYFPKISSSILPNGSMQSNPIDVMSPLLPESMNAQIAALLE